MEAPSWTSYFPLHDQLGVLVAGYIHQSINSQWITTDGPALARLGIRKAAAKISPFSSPQS